MVSEAAVVTAGCIVEPFHYVGVVVCVNGVRSHDGQNVTVIYVI